MLEEGYRIGLTGFTNPEVRALYAPIAAGPLHDLGLGDALERTLLKLLATLPPAHRSDAERLRQRFLLDAGTWGNSGETFPYLWVLQDAVWRECRLQLAYGRPHQEPRERVVAPYGLVAKAGVWYLVGASNGDMRVYRASRISSAEVLVEHFDRDEAFDLAAFWKMWSSRFLASLADYRTSVRVAADFLPALHYIMGDDVRASIERANPPDATGWVTLALEFESLTVARSRLLSCGDRIRVLEPEELRTAMAEMAARICTLYKA